MTVLHKFRLFLAACLLTAFAVGLAVGVWLA